MIKASEKQTELRNLALTFEGIKNLDEAIGKFSESNSRTAYVTFKYASLNDIQINSAFMLEALIKQKQILVAYLKEMEIDYDL